MDQFLKNKFLTYVHSFPYFVKEYNDLLKYCIYMKYKLSKYEAQRDWLERKFIDKHLPEYEKLSDSYDDAFHECKDHKIDFEKGSPDV